MTRIYKRKKVPANVLSWFQKKYPNCEYDFYTYKGRENNSKLIFGCFVMKDGKLWSYSDQREAQEFV